jgi:hypothetical protein
VALRKIEPETAKTDNRRDGKKGVVLGRSLELNPSPPAIDRLEQPLILHDLPLQKAPRSTMSDRWSRFLVGIGFGTGTEEERLRWRALDMLGWVVTSVGGSAAAHMEPISRRAPAAVRFYHPYDLRAAFDLLPRLPDSLGRERRFLELLLNRILRSYGEQVGGVKGSPFSFEHEAHEYFITGIKNERQIRMIGSATEKHDMLQLVSNAYFHARNYYMYALLRREKLLPDSRMHFWYARASIFMARVEWNGDLLDKPNLRQMPPRSTVRFLLRRDKSVMDRYRNDAPYRDQIKRLIDTFPKG